MITVDVKRIDLRPGDRVLDVGCGTGRHVGAAATEKVVVFGIDRAFEDLLAAAERLRTHARMGACVGDWNLAGGDIRAIPFPDAAFDRVICSEVLEHIDDHARAADELVRVLKPGGLLAISVPRSFPERICWALSREYSGSAGGHLRIYRKTEIRQWFESRGLQYRGSHYAHALHTPYWWLKCLVGPGRDDVLPVQLYHRFLVWDLMQRPGITRRMERLLNPVMGKSIVTYLEKPNR